MISNASGGNGYGFGTRVTLKLSDVVALSEAIGADSSGSLTCAIGADFRGDFGTSLRGVVVGTAESPDLGLAGGVVVPIGLAIVCCSLGGDSKPAHCGWM